MNSRVQLAQLEDRGCTVRPSHIPIRMTRMALNLVGEPEMTEKDQHILYRNASSHHLIHKHGVMGSCTTEPRVLYLEIHRGRKATLTYLGFVFRLDHPNNLCLGIKFAGNP